MMKDCGNCGNRCMDMDMEPYCAAVNKPWGKSLAKGKPETCGENSKFWIADERGKLTSKESPLSSIGDLQNAVYTNAVAKGFYDAGFNIPEKLALIHSEVSEALEDFRRGAMETSRTESGKPVGFPSELADVVIRCLDLAGALKINLEQEIREKHAYNLTRPHMHGKRC